VYDRTLTRMRCCGGQTATDITQTIAPLDHDGPQPTVLQKLSEETRVVVCEEDSILYHSFDINVR